MTLYILQTCMMFTDVCSHGCFMFINALSTTRGNFSPYARPCCSCAALTKDKDKVLELSTSPRSNRCADA